MKISIFSFFLALLPLLACADPVEIDGIWYNLTDTKTAEVTKKPADPEYEGSYSGKVTIPEKVTYEGVEYSVESIGIYAFQGCSGLTSVIIPNSVTFIGYNAFWGCSGLTSVTIPASVTHIDDTFDNCSSLTSISVDEGNTDYKSADGVLMSKDGTILFVYPGGKTETTYIIPNGVTTIGYSAFFGCNGLESVTIPNSVTYIDMYAFAYCRNLTSVTIPSSVTEINSSTFSGSGLTSVTIPSSVTQIGSYAFDGCSELTSVTIPSSVTEINNGAFRSCENLVSITVDEANTVYKSVDGVLMSKDGTILIAYPAGKAGYSYTIPDGVTIISDEAFCSSTLNSVSIPGCVTKIGEYAFWGCANLFDVFCHTENVLATESEAFYMNSIIYARLHVPAVLVRPYSITEPWNKFGHVLALENDGIILDELDLNYDGKVNVSDIVVLTAEAETYPNMLDLNNDSQVDANDVAVLVDAIMKPLPPTQGKASAGAVAVDLGLPSGTKWANMNLGAEKPEDYGLYYAWGETKGYKRDASDGHMFLWEHYKFMNEGGTGGQINKYQVADGNTYYGCWYDSEGKFIGDKKRTLDLEDDAAYMNWGSNWRMPTIIEINELLSNTTSEMTTQNGVSGCKFTASNGNSIFLPAAGVRVGPYLSGQMGGNYWSSTLYQWYSEWAYSLRFFPENTPTDGEGDRYFGYSVRPVFRK